MNGSCSRHGRDEFIKNFGWKTWRKETIRMT
jgi:hypothetical protein